MADPIEPPDPFSPGTTVGHFRIVREIGRGGFGVVHLAEDLDIPGRVVALKSIRGGGGASADSLRHEAAALAALQHPHILVVHEVGEASSGVVFLAAEFMPGGSLADRLRNGPLQTNDAIAIARAAADALAVAHDRAIVHRDFKPANLLFTHDGTVKVADFGIALRGGVSTSAPRLPGTEPEEEATLSVSDDAYKVAGTPMYVPPELFAGGMATAKGDQFSFGVSLHEILSGKNPYGRSAGLRGTLGTPSISREIPRDLRKIISRCLERDPARRHPDTRAVVAALDAARARRSPERRRTRRVAIFFASTLVVLLGAWLSWRVVRVRRARALNESGSAALERGDRDAARAAFIAAHGVDPGYLPACTNLGSLAGLEANPSWAVTILRDCASRFPASDVVHYNLGSALRATGNLTEAERDLRKALDLTGQPGVLRAPIANELALVLVASGRAQEAIELIEAEMPHARTSVENTVMTKTLGIALLAAGRPAEALKTLGEAMSRSLASLPPALVPEAMVAMGQAMERTGHPDAAAEAFARAIADGAEGDVAKQAREGLARVQAALK